MNKLLSDTVNYLMTQLASDIVKCNGLELEKWSGKKILVVGSSSNEAVEYIRDISVRMRDTSFTFWGTDRCEKMLGDKLGPNAEFCYHEGRFHTQCGDYKLLRHRNYDIIIYLVSQPHLNQYLNVEEMCMDYADTKSADVYCMDMFSVLWKHIDIKRYVVRKQAIDRLVLLCNLE